jgi:hypothetical protein
MVNTDWERETVRGAANFEPVGSRDDRVLETVSNQCKSLRNQRRRENVGSKRSKHKNGRITKGKTVGTFREKVTGNACHHLSSTFIYPDRLVLDEQKIRIDRSVHGERERAKKGHRKTRLRGPKA